MIDQTIQEQLRAKYNPDGSDLRNLQMRLLKMLDYIDKICKENDIKYWLSSGTCLGAVRHGAFIPWDDDLDIEMLRDDYEKFEKVFFNDDNYQLQTFKNEIFYTEPFSKVRDINTFYQEGSRKGTSNISRLYKRTGIYIDIFIMESTPYFLAESCHFLLGSIRHMSYHLKKNVPCMILFVPLKFFAFGFTFLARKIGLIFNKQVLRHTCGTGCHKNIRMRNEVFPLAKINFEGKPYPVPGNMDSYLRRIFGNYEVLPSEIKTHTLNYKLW